MDFVHKAAACLCLALRQRGVASTATNAALRHQLSDAVDVRYGA